MVSGGARGCDAAAHAAALEEGGRTVAFLGGGCDRLYPAEHEGLFQRIVDEGGAVVSEHAWDEDPKPYRFRLRNRLIAGLARATLIVEAGLPSGTFSTADEALAANRDVLVVPGAITAVSSRGANPPHLPGRDARHRRRDVRGCAALRCSMPEAGDRPFRRARGALRADEPSNLVADALRAEPLSMEQLDAIAASSCGGGCAILAHGAPRPSRARRHRRPPPRRPLGSGGEMREEERDDDVIHVLRHRDHYV